MEVQIVTETDGPTMQTNDNVMEGRILFVRGHYHLKRNHRKRMSEKLKRIIIIICKCFVGLFRVFLYIKCANRGNDFQAGMMNKIIN